MDELQKAKEEMWYWRSLCLQGNIHTIAEAVKDYEKKHLREKEERRERSK